MTTLATDKPNVPTLTPEFIEILAKAYKLGLSQALVSVEAQYNFTKIPELIPLVTHIQAEIDDHRAGFDRLTKGMVPS